MFARLSSLELGLILFGIVLGTTLVGSFLGQRLRAHADTLREPFGVLQAALLGLVALILAFGLTMAVGRYDARRWAVVADANAIGTTYLRAQMLREPIRTRSLEELRRYTDAAIACKPARKYIVTETALSAARLRSGDERDHAWTTAPRRRAVRRSGWYLRRLLCCAVAPRGSGCHRLDAVLRRVSGRLDPARGRPGARRRLLARG